jgi:alkylhydroperoxidase family enzyme
MTWLPETTTGATPIERVFGLRPELFAACRDFATIFWEQRILDPALLELCRMRVGQMLGAEVPALCDAMRDARAALPAAKVADLAGWWMSAAFSETECACLRFAEQFVLDPSGIGDDDAAAVVAALGEPGIVAFVEVLAILDGFSRFARFLDVGETA